MKRIFTLVWLCCMLTLSAQAQKDVSAEELKVMNDEILAACSNGNVSADDQPGIAYNDEIGAFIYFPESFGELITVYSVKIHTTEIDELLVFSFLNGVYYAYLDDNNHIHSVAFQEHFWYPPYSLETSSVEITEKWPFIWIVREGRTAFPKFYMNEGDDVIELDDELEENCTD